MHIGIDASRANRPQKTGIEWYAFNLLNAMKSHALEDTVDLYTNVPLTGELTRMPDGWRERVLTWFPRRVWTQGRLSLEMFTRSPDVLFIPSHVLPAYPSRRVVLTVHDIGFEKRPELYPQWERMYHRLMMRHALRAASHFIAVSSATKQDMMEVYGLSGDRITVVHHGFYGSSGGQRGGDASLLPTTIRDRPYILYVGRIEAKKNVGTLIDAFALLKQRGVLDPRTHLVLAGKRGFRHEETLRQIDRAACAQDIHYLGFVPTQTMHALYANAMLYAFPSLYEGFGFPVLEAMSWGVPVIASDIPAHREVAGDAALFARPTVDAFASAIERIFSDDMLRSDLCAKGARRINQFSWERCARETWNVLRTL
jgi:glycosyltransferase involved in cell wall biosynthesis